MNKCWILKNKQVCTDCFKVLNLPRSATKLEAKMKYKELTMIHHPDLATGSEKKFKEINLAYKEIKSILSKPQTVIQKPKSRRQEYDDFKTNTVKYNNKEQRFEQEYDRKVDEAEKLNRTKFMYYTDEFKYNSQLNYKNRIYLTTDLVEYIIGLSLMIICVSLYVVSEINKLANINVSFKDNKIPTLDNFDDSALFSDNFKSNQYVIHSAPDSDNTLIAHKVSSGKFLNRPYSSLNEFVNTHDYQSNTPRTITRTVFINTEKESEVIKKCKLVEQFSSKSGVGVYDLMIPEIEQNVNNKEWLSEDHRKATLLELYGAASVIKSNPSVHRLTLLQYQPVDSKNTLCSVAIINESREITFKSQNITISGIQNSAAI